MELRGKRVLLSGGARIGQTVAEALARKGCDVALTYRRSRAAADAAVRRIEEAGGRAVPIAGDMTRQKDVDRAVSRAIAALGGLEIVINMVSIYEKTAFDALTEDDWNRGLDANLKSAFLLVRAAMPALKRAGGRIVHIADWLAASGRPRYKDFVPYYAAKSGLIGLMQAQALELAPRVLVNAIAPGPILPPPGLSAAENREVKKVTPLRRWGGAAEIAKAVVFLCETDFVTGECVRVDGGRHLY